MCTNVETKKMSYITKSMTIIITLYSVSWARPSDYYYKSYKEHEVFLKRQGYVQGTVVQLRNYSLPPVEVFRGIPYANPPVDQFRFMPPSSTSNRWSNVKYTTEFEPVCPQKFPDESTMTEERRRYFHRLKQFLIRESEDCLYLNIYAPYQDSKIKSRLYPVIVFLHGESFEWNSGNPYDGSVLAAFGQVIVVTLNFRLGILGFLKVDAEESTTQSNFGLVDQVAALLWIKENIDGFGGDPGRVTLLGHGTGAVCASLLTISPMAIHQNEQLFHRAILMSGTALADWALVSKPLDVSIQVAHALNCQLHDNFASCLRRKRLEEVMNAAAETEPYKTTFGPVVDNFLVPNDPKKSMMQYTDIFKRFELMFGVTEIESLHLPIGGDVALIHGMLERERDEELRKYMRMRCEMKPEACFAETRAKYNYEEQMFQRDQSGYRPYMSQEPDRANLARDELLDILSDARTVAPIVQTGLYHSAVNWQSYFYVFTHKTHSKDYIRNKTYTGEELPYVFGVPIEGSRFHFQEYSYTEDEKRLSMKIMRFICNFANTGNPNVPKTAYTEMDYSKWHQFDKEWIEFEEQEQNYMKFDIPITNEQFYRHKQMLYWNTVFPNLTAPATRNPLPWNRFKLLEEKLNKFENFNKTLKMNPPYGAVKKFGFRDPPNMFREENVYGHIVTTPPEEVKQSSSTLSVLLIVGAVFLLANLAFFTLLYFKCIRNKKSTSNPVEQSSSEENLEEHIYDRDEKNSLLTSCNIVKMLSKSRKDEDTYDAVHVDGKNISEAKLTRALSNSTIDAHAKVRDWITNEIVLKYSPKNDRKPHKDKSKSKIKIKEKQSMHMELPIELDNSIDKCPTRPVSPTEDVPNIARPLLIKTASIDRSNHRKRPNKVSVAIDATPSGRGPSVLMQQPIELSKSLDYPLVSPTPLRRSFTMEDFSPRKIDNTPNEIRKSITSINLKAIDTQPTVIRIEHGHSKSDPVQDIDYSAIKRLKTFDPNNDVNVTSRDDDAEKVAPLTHEEALMTIKRRNFPKVLPDHPGRQAFLSKRRSMPAHNLYIPSLDANQYSSSEPYSPTGRNMLKFPPMPPPRTTTLGRQGSNPQPVCLSEPMLAGEPPDDPEPEMACNNLYVGPLVPKNKNSNSRDQLSMKKCQKDDHVKVEPRAIPRMIITTNTNNPIKRIDPKVVVKPTINRNKNDDKLSNKHIPRVVVPDNRPDIYSRPDVCRSDHQQSSSNKNRSQDLETKTSPSKKSLIPTAIKSSNTSLHKEPSSSESTSPSSEDSDTGTVVKKT